MKAPSPPLDAVDGMVRAQAVALASYLEKPGNRGAAFWFDSKDFSPRQRAAILAALRDLQEDG